jgi:hypothetical protein
MSTATARAPQLPPAWFKHAFWRGHRALHRLSGGRFLWTPAGRLGWGALRLTAIVSHWKESKNLFMLFVTAENLIYIPKRAFASNCEIETFRAAIDSGISGTSHGFPIQIRQPAGQEHAKEEGNSKVERGLS